MPCARWWKCGLMQPLWETVWGFLKKLKIELPYDTTIPLLGIYPKEMQSPSCKYICTPVSTEVIFTIAKIWKQPKCLLMDDYKNGSRLLPDRKQMKIGDKWIDD